MNKAQKVLSDIFVQVETDFKGISSLDLAYVYVDVAFLETAMDFLRDEIWLQKEHTREQVVEALFSHELFSLRYLLPVIDLSSKRSIQRTHDQASYFQKHVLTEILTRSFAEQKIFLTCALQRMSELFVFESGLQAEKKSLGRHLGFSLYRTFDGLDKIFDLNYQADIGMKQDLQIKERLYEGAGVGVQSGYSTVLTALENLSLKPGDRFIDLGSGYGRVGLVVGLMHPEVNFVGYEYVPHRVKIAADSTERLSMEKHVHFLTQDLSLKEFQIPEAEIYYMYDPFSEDTYGHVLSQLIELAKHRKVMIVTKGNARGWLMDVVRQEGWGEPQEFDSGNLCLFVSR